MPQFLEHLNLRWWLEALFLSPAISYSRPLGVVLVLQKNGRTYREETEN